MAWAGWCGACASYVYLTADGRCIQGHGPEYISNRYEVPDLQQAPAAGPQAVPVATATAVPEPSPASLDQLIAEATSLADKHITVTRAGESVLVQSDSLSAARIVEALDRALELAPGDPDLMIAKSDALMHAMQFKTAEEVLDELLARDPDNFEARMRKEHWGEWSSVFTLPQWSVASDSLTSSMQEDLGHARSVQVLRQGVKPVMAVIRPVQSSDMAPGLAGARALWEPVWSPSPAGAIVAHYLLVEDDPANPFRAEAFLPIEPPEKAARMNGYWLLRQLAHADGCWVVLADGERVIYNRWLPFEDYVRSHLAAMEARLTAGAPVAKGQAGFQQAMQWHMNTFDMERVVFGRPLSADEAGVAEATAAPVTAAAPETSAVPETASTPETPVAPAAAASSTPPAGEALSAAEAMLGDPTLDPSMRALLLLNLCTIAENVAPERLDGYWAQLAPMAKLIPGQHAAAYKELAEEMGGGKEDTGAISALLAQVAAGKELLGSRRQDGINTLALAEQRLGERKLPFGKKRVYAALADAWLETDRGQVIRLLGLVSHPACDQVGKRMHERQALTADEWRMLSSVLKPARVAALAAHLLRSKLPVPHLPAELVPAVGDQLRLALSTAPIATGLAEKLDAADHFMASLSAEGRAAEAWAEIEKLYSAAATVQVQQMGNYFLRFAILERLIKDSIISGVLAGVQYAALKTATPAYLQCFARAVYRAFSTQPGAAEAGYRELSQDLTPQELQPVKRKLLGHDPVKLADGGHRAAALTLYFVRLAQRGMLAEVLDLTERLGDTASRDAVVRVMLSEGGEEAYRLLPPERFGQNSIERFLALGSPPKRAEHLKAVTANGTLAIPGCLWRNWEAAQAMPRVKKSFMSSETVPREEDYKEYCEHNPVFGISDLPAPGDARFEPQLFPEYVRTSTNYGREALDRALMPALVAWSEQDWEAARAAMVGMWEVIKPSDLVLQVPTLRQGVLERVFAVLPADPDVMGSYVLPWLHAELVVKGRSWTEGNRQYTLRLADPALASLCAQGGVALAEAAPARRDRLVEIALGFVQGDASSSSTLARVYMIGRPPKFVPPPVELHKKALVGWHEGIVLAVVAEVRRQLLMEAIQEAFEQATVAQGA